MAKRAPKGERPFNPLDESLVRSVISGPPRPDLSYIDRRDREKRVLLTANEERDVERLVERLAGEVGTRLKLSHVLRACYLLLMHAEDEILDRARKAPTLARPGNGNAPELIEFERAIATILSAAFREASPLR
jgi:hypothetical protein